MHRGRPDGRHGRAAGYQYGGFLYAALVLVVKMALRKQNNK